MIIDIVIVLFFIFSKKNFIFQKNNGKILLQQLFEYKDFSKVLFVEYKNFTTIINILLQQSHRYGISLKEPFLMLKKLVLEDLFFEKEKKSFFLETFFQIFILVFFIVTFYFLFKFYLKVKVSYNLLFIILSYLTTITVIFYFLLKIFLEKKFIIYESYFLTIILYKLLIKSNVSLKEVSLISKIHEIAHNKVLLPTKHKILILVGKLFNEGIYSEEDWNLLLEEVKLLWFLAIVQTKKLFVFIKYILIFVFFLPSYFIMVYFLCLGLLKKS